MAKLTNAGMTYFGGLALKEETPDTLYLGLYNNTSEPAVDDEMTDLTEPSGNGYARIELVETGWTQSPAGKWTQPQKDFTADGGNHGSIYGYFICNAPSGTACDLLAVHHASNGPFVWNDTYIIHCTPWISIANPA